MDQYVIRAKRITDIFGNSLSDKDQCWDYAQNDPRSLFPSFADESKKWYADAKIYLKDYMHDWSTLAICEVVCIEVEKLDM